MSNRLKITLVAIALLAILFYVGRFYYAGEKSLLPLIFSAALVDSINPCAISILIITIAFLISLGRVRSHILAVGGSYIAGIFLVYILIGLGILKALSVFNVPHFMSRLGAIVMIGFGIVEILNHYFPNFPIKLAIPQSAHTRIAKRIEAASIPTAFVMGVLVGMYEFPCTGGPYLMVLGLLHDNQTFWTGLAYLIFYNLIFVLPLGIILFIAGDHALISKVERWKKESKWTKLFMGVLMIVLGLVILIL